jgi:hypothetical protein
MESVSEVRPFDLNPGLPWPIATIIPHIYYLEPFTVVTHPLLERADLKTFPVRAFLVAFPSCTSLSYLNKQEQSIAEGLIGARVARRFA